MFLIHRAGVRARPTRRRRSSTATAGSRSPRRRCGRRRSRRGARRVACTRSPACGAGSSTARSGTSPGGATRSRTCSTTSTRPPTGWCKTGLHVTRAAGDRRRVQRWPARRRGADAAARPVPGGVVRRAAARHGAFPAVPDRPAVDRRVRRPRRRRGLRLAARLLAVPPRARGRAVPGGAADHGRGRHTGRSDARPQDGGAAAVGGAATTTRARCCCIRSRGRVTVSASRSASKPTRRPTSSPSSAGNSTDILAGALGYRRVASRRNGRKTSACHRRRAHAGGIGFWSGGGFGAGGGRLARRRSRRVLDP